MLTVLSSIANMIERTYMTTNFFSLIMNKLFITKPGNHEVNGCGHNLAVLNHLALLLLLTCFHIIWEVNVEREREKKCLIYTRRLPCEIFVVLLMVSQFREKSHKIRHDLVSRTNKQVIGVLVSCTGPWINWRLHEAKSQGNANLFRGGGY